MSVPVWVLLAFAGWTLITLAVSVGAYRWARILTGRGSLVEFGHVEDIRDEFHRRAMRAHANCVENLPVYGAIVLVIVVSETRAEILDILALVLIAARVIHTSVHLLFKQTSMIVGLRSTFFNVQFVCMMWMGIYTAATAA
jgi:uncharacterized MAPEG superfamily protein